MKIKLLLILITFSFVTITYPQSQKSNTQIAWDTWGVDHIIANMIIDIFFSQGWEQMNNHAILILELYGSARGKGAESWGKSKLQNDLLIQTLGFDDLANEYKRG